MQECERLGFLTGTLSFIAAQAHFHCPPCLAAYDNKCVFHMGGWWEEPKRNQQESQRAADQRGCEDGAATVKKSGEQTKTVPVVTFVAKIKVCYCVFTLSFITTLVMCMCAFKCTQ